MQRASEHMHQFRYLDVFRRGDIHISSPQYTHTINDQQQLQRLTFWKSKTEEVISNFTSVFIARANINKSEDIMPDAAVDAEIITFLYFIGT